MAFGSPQWMYSSGEYELEQSLRFNDDDSAYLSRTPASAGNQKTWTISLWFKRANLTNDQTIFQAGTTGGNRANIYLANNTIQFLDTTSTDVLFTSSQLLRDVSSWYHLVVQFDTTQGTASDRLKMYLNGTRITAFSDSDTIAQNTDGLVNSTIAHAFGTPAYNSAIAQFDGYLAEVNFIDGQALTPADFGTTSTYGEWKPIEYSGTYGTNGFYLNFAGGGIMSATGGTITTDGDYKVHSFTSSGTFTPTSIPNAGGWVEYLVVGGGGAGGANVGGGGGGGASQTSNFVPADTSYTITVGTGGAGASGYDQAGGNGVASSIAGTGLTTITANGGTGGFTSATGYINPGSSGSGAGGSPGGGAGGITPSAIYGTNNTTGANGTANSITGSSITYGSGGGGGGWDTAAKAGGTNSTGANSGGGGVGASGSNAAGGAGQAGIVIIRYKFQ